MDAAIDTLTRMNRIRLVERIRTFSPENNIDWGDHQLNPDMLPQGNLTQAAVLIPVVERTDGFTVLFTQRTQHLAHHPGQISFPGGHRDPEDDTLEDTALRETEEEVGIGREHIEVIGRISQYKTRTGFDVTPVVAIVKPEFKVKADPFEVAEVFEVPLLFLLNPANHEKHKRKFEGRDREFYAMPYKDYFIWGATAGMLINFYEVLNRP